MYGNIPFAIGNKTIEIGDQVFDLGRLTTDTLNIPDEEIQKWITLGDSLYEDMAQYGRDHDILHWRQSCKKLVQLDRRMCAFRLFRCIRTDDGILSEFSTFLKDLNPPGDMTEDIWLRMGLDDIPYRRLCCCHNLSEIWNLYRKHVEVIRSMVSDLVTIDTLSFKEDAKAVHWECDGTSTYSMDDSDRAAVGTTVTLHLTDDCVEFSNYWKVRETAQK